jgi:lipopolysaccharide transport system permease protein
MASIDRVSRAPKTLEEPAATRSPVEISRNGLGVAPEDTPAAAGRVTIIRPASRWPHLDVPELWHFRELLWTLVWRDVVVRYKQTFLGIAWAILVPAFTAFIYIIVFGKFANFPDGGLPYPALVIGGVLPMQYFASALTNSSMSLAANLQLVTKVYFPRALLPLSAVIVPLVDFVVGLPVLIVLMWVYETWPGGWEVLAAPLFMLLALVFALGTGFFLSALNVRYRDVRYMVTFGMQLWLFISPVAYPNQLVSGGWNWVYALNPMVGVLTLMRWTLLDGPAPDWTMLPSMGAALLVMLTGVAYFQRTERRFADVI